MSEDTTKTAMLEKLGEFESVKERSTSKSMDDKILFNVFMDDYDAVINLVESSDSWEFVYQQRAGQNWKKVGIQVA